jgi:hypothetical protein
MCRKVKGVTESWVVKSEVKCVLQVKCLEGGGLLGAGN